MAYTSLATSLVEELETNESSRLKTVVFIKNASKKIARYYIHKHHVDENDAHIDMAVADCKEMGRFMKYLHIEFYDKMWIDIFDIACDHIRTKTIIPLSTEHSEPLANQKMVLLFDIFAYTIYQTTPKPEWVDITHLLAGLLADIMGSDPSVVSQYEVQINRVLNLYKETYGVK